MSLAVTAHNGNETHLLISHLNAYSPLARGSSHISLNLEMSISLVRVVTCIYSESLNSIYYKNGLGISF